MLADLPKIKHVAVMQYETFLLHRDSQGYFNAVLGRLGISPITEPLPIKGAKARRDFRGDRKQPQLDKSQVQRMYWTHHSPLTSLKRHTNGFRRTWLRKPSGRTYARPSPHVLKQKSIGSDTRFST